MGYIGNNKKRLLAVKALPPKAEHTGFDVQRELCGVGMKSLLPLQMSMRRRNSSNTFAKVLSLSAIRVFTSSTSHCLRLSERF